MLKKEISLDEVIAEAGLTQAELARRVNSNPSTINRIIRGKRTPLLKVAKAIAAELNTTVEELFS